MSSLKIHDFVYVQGDGDDIYQIMEIAGTGAFVGGIFPYKRVRSESLTKLKPISMDKIEQKLKVLQMNVADLKQAIAQNKKPV
jgi:hypothetical protein